MNRFVLVTSLLALGCADATYGSPLWEAAPEPELPARSEVTVRDSSTDTWVRSRGGMLVDAGVSGALTRVPRLGPDGGVIRPEPDTTPAEPTVRADAGQPASMDEDAGGAEPVECHATGCLCERLCERGLALACPADESLPICIEQCDVASSDCYEPLLRLLRCKVALPDAAYSCDPDFLAFVVEGCAAETAALQTCRTF